MKLLNPIRLSVGLAALFVAQAGWAAGTLAGTDVSNTATLTYSVGATTQAPVTSNTTIFEVDRKVDLNVTGAALTAPVIASPSETGVQLVYTLTNEGNSTQNYNVNVSHVAGDDFDAGEGTTASPTPQVDCDVTISRTGLPDVTGTVTSPTATPINVVDLAPDAEATITVECVMPNKPDVVDGDISIIDVSATALEPSTDQGLFTTAPAANAALTNSTGLDVADQVDTVFADAAGISGTQTTDSAVENATHSATHSYEIVSPELSVVKSSTVEADPVTCGNALDSNNNYSAYTPADALTASCANAKRIPGSVIMYTITINNASDTAPSNVSIADALQADVTFVPGSVEVDGSAHPAANVDFTDPNLTVDSIAVPAGPAGSAVLTFRAIVN